MEKLLSLLQVGLGDMHLYGGKISKETMKEKVELKSALGKG